MPSDSVQSSSEKTFSTNFDFKDDTEALTVQLAESIAEIKNTSQEELPPIGSQIPLDEINRLFNSSLVSTDDELMMSFIYENTKIKITGQGTIELTPV